MSRSVSYTRATSYLWCATVIEVEPHRTAVGVYTPVECSSDLMRRAAISLSFLESTDPPPIFARPLLALDHHFLETWRLFPPLPTLPPPPFPESRREISAEARVGPLAPRPKIIVMGFRARDIDAWSTAGGEAGWGGREGEREKEWKGREGSVDGPLSKGCRRKGWGRAKRAARALNRPMAISNRMPWRCRCALIIKRRYNKARIIGHKARPD